MFESEAFAIPVALDAQKVPWRPETAEKSKSYTCPECESPVILKRGPIKRAHYAHKVEIQCNPESRLHKCAKNLIVATIDNWKRGGRKPEIEAPRCGKGHHRIIEIADGIDSAKLEYRLINGRVVDVGLLEGPQVSMLVEIFVCHKVDQKKRQDLIYPWIELDANQVISNPDNWIPRQYGLEIPICKVCFDEDQWREGKIEAERQKIKRRQFLYGWKTPVAIGSQTAQMIPDEQVDKALHAISKILQRTPVPDHPIILPSSAVVSDTERFQSILTEFAGPNSDYVFQKRAVLWRGMEYLQGLIDDCKEKGDQERPVEDIKKVLSWLVDFHASPLIQI